MERENRNRKRQGLAKLEHLLLIAAIAWLGAASFTGLGQSYGSILVDGSVSKNPAQPHITLVSRAHAGVVKEIAQIARRAAEVVRGGKTVKLADLPTRSALLQPTIPLEKVRAAAEFLDTDALARIPDRQISSVDDLLVFDTEFLRFDEGNVEARRAFFEGQIPEFEPFEYGWTTVVDGREVQRSLSVRPRLDLYATSQNYRARSAFDPAKNELPAIPHDQAFLELAGLALKREIATYNTVDIPALQRDLEKLSPELRARVNQVREFQEANPDAYRIVFEHAEDILAPEIRNILSQADDTPLWESLEKTDAFKGFNKSATDLLRERFDNVEATEFDPAGLLLESLETRLIDEEAIDLLVGVQLYEADGRGNSLIAASQRLLPTEQQLVDRVQGEKLSTITAHQADVDAVATHRIARSSSAIRNALERNLPQYLREQTAFRILQDEVQRVVGAGIERDTLLRKKLSNVNFGFVEVASTKPRGRGRYGQLTKIGFGERSPRTTFTQVGDRYVPSFVMDGIGDDEIFVRPVRYKTPNSRKHQPRSFVDADIDNQATRQSGIEDSTVRGERALGEAAQPTFIQIWDELRGRFDQADAWVAWNADEEVGVLGREVTPIVNIEGAESLPVSMQRQFIDLERVILNLLDENSKKMLRMKLNLESNAELRLPVRKAYELVTGETTRSPTGSSAQNARIARVIFEKLQNEGGLGSTFDDLLKAQQGTDVKPRLYYDNDRIRVGGGK